MWRREQNLPDLSLVAKARLDRTHPFSFGRNFLEILRQKGTGNGNLSSGTEISNQTGPTEKCSVGPYCFILFRTKRFGNFQNFGQMESAAENRIKIR